MMTGKTSSKYDLRGVSSGKEDVHQAIKNLDKGVFPKAFCKVLPDILGGDDSFCNLLHADGAGSKPIIAYLYWKETGDVTVWKGLIHDAIVMNLDDLLCVGAVNNFIVSTTIARNKHFIDGKIISLLINSTEEFIKEMKDYGINISSAGGETEDVGDSVRTLLVNANITCRIKKENIIDFNNIRSSEVIVGLSSFGKCKYEKEYNSGIGCNGLTSARHDLLKKEYKRDYPESYDPKTEDAYIFSGRKKLSDSVPTLNMTLGKLLLSPTRTYAPIIHEIINRFPKMIHGIVHCTGGGQTKPLKLIGKLHIIKNQLFDVPPFFKLLQECNNTPWREMYEVYNMGHLMEIYLPEKFAERVINISKSYGVDAKIIGYTERCSNPRISIFTKNGKFVYTLAD